MLRVTWKAAACGLLLALAASGSALADPCKAVPDRGPTPAHLQPGSSFQGPVSYVGDGDSLCVALGPSGGEWVEVRLADFYAPELSEAGGREAKAALEAIALGRQVQCRAGRRSYDRIVATCRLGRASLGDLMRKRGIVEGGAGR